MSKGISTAIRITDGMSPSLRSMNKALMVVLNTFESMQSATADPINTAAISEARSELAKVETTLDDVENGARKAANAQDNFTNSVHNSDKAMGGLIRKVGSLVATYASFQAMGKLVDLSDQVTQIDSRLNLIVDDSQLKSIENQIMASANRSRASYLDTADIVSKMALRAGDAFKGADEKVDMNQIIGFTENLNKLYAIAGATGEEQASSMLQLTQALGSGVLRGEEFNAVFEAAPNIMQKVADYIGVPIGQLREMAAEGEITAEVVKNAILGATDSINSDFESINMTWSQVMTLAKNRALGAFDPVLRKINELARNQSVQNFVNNMANNVAYIANLTLTAFEKLASMAKFVKDNWSIISPIIMGVVTAMTIYAAVSSILTTVNGAMALAESVKAAALMMSTGATLSATVAQTGFNAALLACPITWILIAIIAVVAAVIAFCAWIAKSGGVATTAFGVIAGAVNTAVAYIWNQFVGLVDLVLAVVNYIAAPWVAFANFFGNIFNDPVASIIHLFGDMADAILGILEGIARAIDAVFGSNLSNAVSGWRSGLDDKVNALAKDKGNGSYEQVMEKVNLTSETFGIERKDYKDAYATGAAWGDGVSEKVSGAFKNFSMDSLLSSPEDALGGGVSSFDVPNYDEIAGNLNDINDNTKGIKDSVDISDEDLKYMRDIAEQEAINRFTTAEISVDFGGVSNNISSDVDLDGFMETFTDRLVESASVAAEGLHS